MSTKGECVRQKNYERNIKLPFIIYADFESILVPKDNVKHNPDESYTKKYQKHVSCRFGFKLIFVDDRFRKSFKSYVGEDAVYSFFNSMLEESKSSDLIKTFFVF